MNDRSAKSLEMVPSVELSESRRRVSRWLFRSAGAIAIVVLWMGIVGASDGESRDLGEFPAFALPALDGSALDREAIDGHVTVVNFWASWCPPCRSEAPILARVADDTEADGVRFVGVLHNDRREPALEFAASHGLEFPTVIDDGGLARSLGVRSIPMTFVVGVDGSILARHFGPITESRLRVLIADAHNVAARAGASE